MLSLLKNRLYQLLLVVWGVGTLTFILMRALPGDMAYRIAASRYGQDNVDSDAAQLVREELNLDLGLWQSYLNWFLDLLQFNLGRSLVSGLPVIDAIEHQLGHSLVLALAGIVISVLIALPLGICSAHRPGWFNYTLIGLSTFTKSLPFFVLGIILILLFSIQWQLLPVAGFSTWQHLVLPSITLAIGLAAVSNRVVHASTLNVIHASFYRFARVKGLTPLQCFMRHGVRNISLPVIAFIGVQLVGVIEGIIMIESLFSWPGIGHGLAHAIFARDIPVIQGCALMMGALFVVLNTVVDLLCYWIDPRGAHSL